MICCFDRRQVKLLASIKLDADKVWITAVRALPIPRLKAMHNGVHSAQGVLAVELTAPELIVRAGILGNHLTFIVSIISQSA